MSERTGFLRKLGYGVAIAVLLFPLSLLSAPATVDSPGGKLARLRTEHRLGQGDLGEIDPASETIKLATLGLRGLAVNLLWEKANHYKKVEDWTNLTATLEQLSKLQPNFITFWKFQSWNLSYNVSVEFDDFRDRYYWVRRGIQFLQQGAKYNRDNAVLLWELGWVNGQKVGRSDEKKQYRELYKQDEDFHPVDRTPAERDNWLVSKSRYLESIATVEEDPKKLGKKSPALFFSSPSKSQMSYAEAIEDEGLFELAVAAWKKAGNEWADFGRVLVQHSQGPFLQLGLEDELAEVVEGLRGRLVAMMEGVEERVVADARASLTEEQREVLEAPYGELTSEQQSLRYEAERLLKVTPDKLASKIAEETPERQREAAALAAELMETDKRLRFTRNYKDTTNYDYWALRCEFEQTEAAVTARQKVYSAEKAFREQGDPSQAKELYDEAFDRWSEVFEEFPDLLDPSGTTGGDIMFILYDYKKVLDQLDEQLADDFPLWDLIEQFDTEGEFTVEIRERQQRSGDEERSQQPASDSSEAEVSEAAAGNEESGEDAASESAPAETPAG